MRLPLPVQLESRDGALDDAGITNGWIETDGIAQVFKRPGLDLVLDVGYGTINTDIPGFNSYDMFYPAFRQPVLWNDGFNSYDVFFPAGGLIGKTEKPIVTPPLLPVDITGTVEGVGFIVTGWDGTVANPVVPGYIDNGEMFVWPEVTNVPLKIIPQVVIAGYVAVGNISKVATSSDGITWTAGTISTGNYYDVVYGNGKYVAVGEGVCATSTDGFTWTARSIPAGIHYSVIWTGTQFVSVGAGVCATSPDGITWTNRPSAIGDLSVAWNGSLLLFTGTGGNASTSPDGVTWTDVSPLPLSNDYIVTSNGTNFLIADNVGSTNVYTSPDGVNWTIHAVGTSYSGTSADWNGSIYCIVGAANSSVSADAISWTNTSSFSSANGVGHSSTQFVVVGINTCYTSPDGVTWTSRTIPAGSYYGVASSI